MKYHFPAIALAFLLSLSLGSIAQADNLGQFDARSLAMGGAGVAGAQSANAAAYNPALMATESNKNRFSIIPLVVKVEAYDENGFIDTVDDVDQSINEDQVGLLDLLDTLDNVEESTCDGSPCYKSNTMAPTSAKASETFISIQSLNDSNALVNANTGVAIQLGQKIPMAFIIDGGANVRVGLKFANSDFNELQTYADVMEDGELSPDDVKELLDQGLITIDESAVPSVPDKITFVRGSDNSENEKLQSLVEVIGAKYGEFGVSFADSFKYMDRDLAVGITPKIVKIEAVKYHQTVEDDFETGDIFDEQNITSKTDFNADIGAVFKPLESQPLQVGVTLKNLFTRTYDLKKSSKELAIEAAAENGDANAQTDLDKFNFRQNLKLEPQLTVGVAYDLPFFNLLADLDLNKAEVLGSTTQDLSLGAEFDLNVLRMQLGYKTSIGGDDRDDAVSAGLGLGPVALAVVAAGDNIGGVIQFGFSF
jgi:hypothetical protein